MAQEHSYSDSEFEKLLSDYDYSFTKGDLVKGIVCSYDSQGAVVDIGAKTAAYVPEREAVVEFLKNRKELDGYTRMTNERGRIVISKNILSHLLAKEPNSPLINQLREELAKKGNIDSVLATLKKKIALAESKHKAAINYFRDLRKLEEVYEKNSLINDTDLNQFWYDVNKNNINKDGNLNTQELIDIITGEKDNVKQVAPAEVAAHKIQKTARILTKKQLIANIQSEFEFLLRKNIDFYRIMNNSLIRSVELNTKSKEEIDTISIPIAMEVQKAHNAIWDKYIDSIEISTDIEQAVNKTMSKILEKYRRNANTMSNRILQLQNVGAYWKYMEDGGIMVQDGKLINEEGGLAELKRYSREIDEIKKLLKFNKGDKTLLKKLAKKEINMAETKETWTENLINAVNAEKFNEQECIKNGSRGLYNYITGENASIRNYRALDEIRKENEGVLPEETWNRILTYANEDGTITDEAWKQILA